MESSGPVQWEESNGPAQGGTRWPRAGGNPVAQGRVESSGPKQNGIQWPEAGVNPAGQSREVGGATRSQEEQLGGARVG